MDYLEQISLDIQRKQAAEEEDGEAEGGEAEGGEGGEDAPSGAREANRDDGPAGVAAHGDGGGGGGAAGGGAPPPAAAAVGGGDKDDELSVF